jgi:hypothetical protein
MRCRWAGLLVLLIALQAAQYAEECDGSLLDLLRTEADVPVAYMEDMVQRLLEDQDAHARQQNSIVAKLSSLAKTLHEQLDRREHAFEATIRRQCRNIQHLYSACVVQELSNAHELWRWTYAANKKVLLHISKQLEMWRRAMQKRKSTDDLKVTARSRTSAAILTLAMGVVAKRPAVGSLMALFMHAQDATAVEPGSATMSGKLKSHRQLLAVSGGMPLVVQNTVLGSSEKEDRNPKCGKIRMRPKKEYFKLLAKPTKCAKSKDWRCVIGDPYKRDSRCGDQQSVNNRNPPPTLSPVPITSPHYKSWGKKIELCRAFWCCVQARKT